MHTLQWDFWDLLGRAREMGQVVDPESTGTFVVQNLYSKELEEELEELVLTGIEIDLT
jgi:hypothetical protein